MAKQNGDGAVSRPPGYGLTTPWNGGRVSMALPESEIDGAGRPLLAGESVCPVQNRVVVCDTERCIWKEVCKV